MRAMRLLRHTRHFERNDDAQRPKTAEGSLQGIHSRRRIMLFPYSGRAVPDLLHSHPV